MTNTTNAKTNLTVLSLRICLPRLILVSSMNCSLKEKFLIKLWNNHAINEKRSMLKFSYEVLFNQNIKLFVSFLTLPQMFMWTSFADYFKCVFNATLLTATYESLSWHWKKHFCMRFKKCVLLRFNSDLIDLLSWTWHREFQHKFTTFKEEQFLIITFTVNIDLSFDKWNANKSNLEDETVIFKIWCKILQKRRRIFVLYLG